MSRFLRPQEFLRLHIALPNLEEQHAIVEAKRQIENERQNLDGLSLMLASDLRSHALVARTLEERLAVAAAERVRALARQGESTRLEFKKYLSWNGKAQKKSRENTSKVLAEVVGFLNTNGGILLVGVDDNGNLTGLECEIGTVHESFDELLEYWKNHLRSRIGDKVFSLVESSLVKVDSHTVLVVDCQAADEAFYLDDRFLVRQLTATQELKGSAHGTFVLDRFGTGN